MKDITGQRFGRLQAVNVHHSYNHKRYWECICDCGNNAVIRQDQLITGKTKSCGCYLNETRMNFARKYVKPKNMKSKKVSYKIDGHTCRYNLLKHQYPRIYRIWKSMKSRCYYTKNKCYSSYGGRGISICDEWRQSFNTFANWALCNGYKDNLSIDRIDVNSDYTPENCRWITMAEQQKNKRKSPTNK